MYAYLRALHSLANVWRAMIDDGSIGDHCRRRAVEAQIIAQGARADLWRAVMTGEFNANQAAAIPEVVAEIVEKHLRKL